jgi:hypothetical protein
MGMLTNPFRNERMANAGVSREKELNREDIGQKTTVWGNIMPGSWRCDSSSSHT